MHTRQTLNEHKGVKRAGAMVSQSISPLPAINAVVHVTRSGWNGWRTVAWVVPPSTGTWDMGGRHLFFVLFCLILFFTNCFFSLFNVHENNGRHEGVHQIVQGCGEDEAGHAPPQQTEEAPHAAAFFYGAVMPSLPRGYIY
jgi:hypothetical protein